MTDHDEIAAPHWYTWHPSGVEAQTVAAEFPWNLGAVITYIWRAGRKTADPLEDLRKARRHLDMEIARIEARNARRARP